MSIGAYTHMRGLEDVEKPATVVQKSLELTLCLFPVLVGLLGSLLQDIFGRRVAWKAQANLWKNAQEPTSRQKQGKLHGTRMKLELVHAGASFHLTPLFPQKPSFPAGKTASIHACLQTSSWAFPSLEVS